MRAVVLVGGFGTRLRPLTLTTPKQMLPVVDQPMIERVVRSLGSHGVTEAILSLGYRPDAFMESYPDGICAGVRLTYAVEPEPLDTAGAVGFAARSAGVEETFIVVNGDVLTDLDVSALWEFHRSHGGEGTIALTPVDDPSRYGVVPIDDDGRVIEFVEKPPAGTAPSNWVNAGTYVLEPSVLERIDEGRKVSIERETFPGLAADRSLFAVQSSAYWLDAGTPASYLQAQLDIIDGLRGRPEVPVHPTAQFHDDAQVTHSVVMQGAQIGPTVRISAARRPSRIWENSEAVRRWLRWEYQSAECCAIWGRARSAVGGATGRLSTTNS
ncbi:MAG: nucleotidyltransferase family protein [Actinobacteria bacterium]|nr:nucleotidyltransferase family protein [Actinomycetota bacterium]